MKCLSCGIKSEKKFCSTRCEQYGVGSHYKTKHSKYPYKAKCVMCKNDYMKTSWSKMKCQDCMYVVQSDTNKNNARNRKKTKTKTVQTVCERCHKEFSYSMKYIHDTRLYCGLKCMRAAQSGLNARHFEENRHVRETESLGQVRW